jgi:hypothetical protein
MSSASKILLAGLRGSGKTSYLAALWNLIEAGELPTSLTTSQLQPDRTYLNGIRDKWLRFQEVGRTSLRSHEIVSLLLNDARTGDIVDLNLPDLSGELFRLQWATRKATTRYATFAGESSGVMLFIHPKMVKKTPPIFLPEEQPALSTPVQSISVAAPTEEAAFAAVSARAKPWSSDLSPTQVQVVELLQFVKWLHPPDNSVRVAVIVSAWDLIHDPVLPKSWLENRLPLLFQFLIANADRVPFKIFGVSALGGDLVKDIAQLQNESVPARRIKVVDRDLQPHKDLTAPIRFLLALDRDEHPPE